uniref:Uncharacterized protein n=1 Tax=Dunaliella tertiolecta TaxID=3047 RepID=A0A7S3R6U6_DUNTE
MHPSRHCPPQIQCRYCAHHGVPLRFLTVSLSTQTLLVCLPDLLLMNLNFLQSCCSPMPGQPDICPPACLQLMHPSDAPTHMLAAFVVPPAILLLTHAWRCSHPSDAYTRLPAARELPPAIPMLTHAPPT